MPTKSRGEVLITALLSHVYLGASFTWRRTMGPDVNQRLIARLCAVVLSMPVALLLHGVPNVLAGENVPFEELGGERCFMFSHLVPLRAEGDHYVRPPIELVINNEEDYRKLFEPRIRKQSCDDMDPAKIIPSVDFSKKTVLGLFTGGSCADTDLERQVLRDDSQKWVIFSVTISGSDIACSGPGLQSLNLVAVPKIPAGYKVFFENLRGYK